MEGNVVSKTNNNMKKPTKFPINLSVAVGVLSIAVVVFVGYGGIGHLLSSPVTVNFLITVVPPLLRNFMTFMTALKFAMYFWAPLDLVWSHLSKKLDPRYHWIWEPVYRAVIVTSITGIAAAFPSTENFISLLGGLCLSIMSFMYPAMIQLLMMWRTPGVSSTWFKWWRFWKNISKMLLGGWIFLNGPYATIKGLLRS